MLNNSIAAKYYLSLTSVYMYIYAINLQGSRVTLISDWVEFLMNMVTRILIMFPIRHKHILWLIYRKIIFTVTKIRYHVVIREKKHKK